MARTTTFRPSIGLGSITALMSFDSADYEDDFGLESLSYSESSGTPNIQPSTCDGSISLHDKTYLRGLNITLTDDMEASQPRPPRSPRSSHRSRSMVTAAGPSTKRPNRWVNPRGSLPGRARVPATWEPCSGQLGLSKSQCAEDSI